MVAHDILSRHRLSRRQVEPVAPTGNGIADGVTATTGIVEETALAFDSSVVRITPTVKVPDLVATSTGAVNLTPTVKTTSSTTDVAGATSVAGATAASSVISMGTVVGACVGALVGAAFLILIGVLFYRRSAPKRRGPLSSNARNMHGNNSRALAAQESWDKLDGSGDDKWESQFPSPTTKREGGEMETVAPMEKLTMFSKKSTPSIRTAYTSHADVEPPNLGSHPFAAYYPGLAQDMSHEEATPRPFLARVDAGPALSWSETGSFNVSLKNRLSSGAMSPSLELVTPHIISHHEPHQWHSAEVLNYDPEVADQSQLAAQPAQSTNPFMADNERDRVSVVEPSIPWHMKGKGRDLTGGDGSDPFSDETAMPVPQLTHTAASSLTSNDRAIQSLIAAMGMEGQELDIQERLRVASMQPSVVSANSVYTEDEDVTQSFPLPPSTKP